MRVQLLLYKRTVTHSGVNNRMNDSQKLDLILSKLNGIDARLDGMDSRFDGMDSRFDGIDARFDGIDTRFDGIDAKIENLDLEVRAIKLNIENEISRNIMIIAEGHLDLSRKLDEAITISNGIKAKQEIQDIYLNRHEAILKAL